MENKETQRAGITIVDVKEVDDVLVDELMENKETTLSDKGFVFGCNGKAINYSHEDVKEFIEKRIYASTKLIALFNQGKLTAYDLREHRQKIKDDAGKELGGQDG